MIVLLSVLFISITYVVFKIILLQREINKEIGRIEIKQRILQIEIEKNKKRITELEGQVNDPDEIKLFYGR